jgi:putative cardiolipin synthase
MHNKCWIADGRVMIAGGRNIGDAYFDAAETSNFQDIDVIGIGACVATASAVFDRYWNSEPAVPIRLLRNRMRRPRLARLQRRLAIHCAGDRPRAYLAMAEREPPCLDDLSGFEWTSAAEIIADPPEKASGKGHEHWLCSRFDPMIEGVKHTLFLISPYFIPGRTVSATLARLARRGADIRILTNSLAATDVIAVHGAYARYRRTLVATGIALYELKPEPGRGRASLFGSRTASLHTKAFLIDDEDAFVGSFNLDPRSRSINTEMGILFRCPALTRQLRAIFEAQTRPESSYRLVLENGRLRWRETRDGVPVRHSSEPEATLKRRIPAWVIGWLPIESQL